LESGLTAGHIGNLITVTLVDPGKANESLSITVTGFDIVVSLATGGDKAITSTPATIVAAVNGDDSAKLLVLAAGTGTDPVEAVVKLTYPAVLIRRLPGRRRAAQRR